MDHEPSNFERSAGDSARISGRAAGTSEADLGNAVLGRGLDNLQAQRDAYCADNGIVSKPCSVCKQTLSLSSFGKRKQMKLGRASACFSCEAAKDAQRWERRREAHNEWARNRNDRKSKRLSRAAYDARYPDARHARSLLHSAFRYGKLKKPTLCEAAPLGNCRGVIHAHHEDYSNPLSFVALCRKHHNDVHNSGVLHVGDRTFFAPTPPNEPRATRWQERANG